MSAEEARTERMMAREWMRRGARQTQKLAGTYLSNPDMAHAGVLEDGAYILLPVDCYVPGASVYRLHALTCDTDQSGKKVAKWKGLGHITLREKGSWFPTMTTRSFKDKVDDITGLITRVEIVEDKIATVGIKPSLCFGCSEIKAFRIPISVIGNEEGLSCSATQSQMMRCREPNHSVCDPIFYSGVKCISLEEGRHPSGVFETHRYFGMGDIPPSPCNPKGEREMLEASADLMAADISKAKASCSQDEYVAEIKSKLDHYKHLLHVMDQTEDESQEGIVVDGVMDASAEQWRSAMDFVLSLIQANLISSRSNHLDPGMWVSALDQIRGVSEASGSGFSTFERCNLMWAVTLAFLALGENTPARGGKGSRSYLSRAICKALADASWHACVRADEERWVFVSRKSPPPASSHPRERTARLLQFDGAVRRHGHGLGCLPHLFERACSHYDLKFRVVSPGSGPCPEDGRGGPADISLLTSQLFFAGALVHRNKVVLECNDLLKLLSAPGFSAASKSRLVVASGRPFVGCAHIMSELCRSYLEDVYAMQMDHFAARPEAAEALYSSLFKIETASRVRKSLGVEVRNLLDSGSYQRQSVAEYASIQFYSSHDAPPCMVNALKKAHGDANAARFKVWSGLVASGVPVNTVKEWWRSVYRTRTGGGVVNESTRAQHDRTIDKLSHESRCVSCTTLINTGLCPLPDVEDLGRQFSCMKIATGSDRVDRPIANPRQFSRIRKKIRQERAEGAVHRESPASVQEGGASTRCESHMECEDSVECGAGKGAATGSDVGRRTGRDRADELTPPRHPVPTEPETMSEDDWWAAHASELTF